MNDFVTFWKPSDEFGWLSQWASSPLVNGGRSFPTAEHWMMCAKARLFGQVEMFERILGCDGPAEAQMLGRQVAGFDEARWAEHRFRVVVAGNLLKFTQHPELGRQLRGTGDAVLVEASPRDRVWGAGVDAGHVRTYGTWPGENLLGEALMQVRSVLVAAAEARPDGGFRAAGDASAPL